MDVKQLLNFFEVYTKSITKNNIPFLLINLQVKISTVYFHAVLSLQ